MEHGAWSLSIEKSITIVTLHILKSSLTLFGYNSKLDFNEQNSIINLY